MEFGAFGKQRQLKLSNLWLKEQYALCWSVNLVTAFISDNKVEEDQIFAAACLEMWVSTQQQWLWNVSLLILSPVATVLVRYLWLESWVKVSIRVLRRHSLLFFHRTEYFDIMLPFCAKCPIIFLNIILALGVLRNRCYTGGNNNSFPRQIASREAGT